MRKMIVAIWSLNTQTTQDVDLDSRIDDITKCLGRLKSKMAVDKEVTESPRAMLVVPEYFLANPTSGIPGVTGHHPGGKPYSIRRHLDENTKNIYVRKLEQLSLAYKEILFIPGTIAWRKHLWGPAKPNGKLEREDKAIRDVRAYATSFNLPLALPLSGPSGNVTAPTTQGKLTALQDFKNDMFTSTTQYMARNTAYVLLDGNVKLKYHKKGDYHEVTVGNDTVHIPGHLDGRFSLGGKIHCSIEVCLDHIFGTGNATKEHYGESDIHIIASAQVKLDKNAIPIKTGGYVVHACSNVEYSKVIYNNGYWYSEQDPFATDTIAGARLAFYMIGG